MTGSRLLASVAFGLVFISAPAIAAAFDAQAAKKTCLDNYEAEKAAGTIPAGMPKTKYVTQCTNSMRRDANLEKELAEAQAQAQANNTTPTAAGSNEITASKPGKTGLGQPATSKPAAVSTPAFAPRGY